MRRQLPALLVALSIGSATPLHAQVPEWVTQILAAAQLPLVTAEARREGVASDEIRAVLDAMGRAGVPAHEATAVIDTARVVRREHGATENFGAFVQSQLAAGKRGRELSAAIRTEHERLGRGRGRGPGNAARGTDDRGRGNADTARGRGRSGASRPGQPEVRNPRTQDTRGRGRGVPVPPNR